MDGDKVVGGLNFSFAKCKVKMQHDVIVPHMPAMVEDQ